MKISGFISPKSFKKFPIKLGWSEHAALPWPITRELELVLLLCRRFKKALFSYLSKLFSYKF